MSVKPSARNNSSAMSCGATQMLGIFGSLTEAVSSAPSAATVPGERTRLAAPAADNPTRKWRRVGANDIGNLPFSWLRLQLAFELVQKAPVRAVGDDLLRARLDHADFVQTERIEPYRVLGIVFAPFVVGQLAEPLQSVVVPIGKTAIGEPSCDLGGVGGAPIRGLEDGAQHPLAGNRILSDVVAVADQHAAEILRPGPINRTIDDDMPDVPRPQILWRRREAEERIDLSAREKLVHWGG